MKSWKRTVRNENPDSIYTDHNPKNYPVSETIQTARLLCYMRYTWKCNFNANSDKRFSKAWYSVIYWRIPAKVRFLWRTIWKIHHWSRPSALSSIRAILLAAHTRRIWTCILCKYKQRMTICHRTQRTISLELHARMYVVPHLLVGKRRKKVYDSDENEYLALERMRTDYSRELLEQKVL